jgi:hypothetical protein
MDEIKLALEMNKLIHNECKDVPHDIGLRLLEVVKKHVGEQLNLPPVSNSLPVDYLQKEMIKAIKELAKESTAPDKDTPDWMENDNLKHEKQCAIHDVRRSALDWWNKLDKWKQRTIERETFGDGEIWEDNTLVDADIITMYKRHYA